MKALFLAVGTAALPLRVDRQRLNITFTLRVDDDRFFITTVGWDQYQRLTEHVQRENCHTAAAIKLLVLGYTFTFRSNKCGQHHVGVKPIVLMPFDDKTELLDVQDLLSQIFLQSVISMR